MRPNPEKPPYFGFGFSSCFFSSGGGMGSSEADLEPVSLLPVVSGSAELRESELELLWELLVSLSSLSLLLLAMSGDREGTSGLGDLGAGLLYVIPKPAKPPYLG